MRHLGQSTAIGLGIVALLLISGCQPGSRATQLPPQPPVVVQDKPTVVTPPKPTMPALKSESLTKKNKDQNGYSSSIKEAIWQPIPADFTSPFQHPLDSAVTIDPSSDYDPKTDVVIPYSVTLTNTTEGYSIDKPRIQYQLWPIQVSDGSINSPRTIETWDWHSDGWSKNTWDVTNATGFGESGLRVEMQNPSMGTWPTTEWSTPLAPGASDTVNGFFVYRDQLTPAEPKGTRWTLDNVALDAFGGSGIVPPFLSLSGKLVPKQ